MNENTDMLVIEDAKVFTQALMNVLPYLKTDVARNAVIKQISDFSSILTLINFVETMTSNDQQVQPSLIDDIMSVGQGE